MIIGADIRSLLEEEYSGVSVYTKHVISGMVASDKENSYRLFYNSHKPKNIGFFHKENASIYEYRIPNKIFNASLRILKRPRIDSLLGGIDIFFLPNIQFFSIRKTVPYVLTVHDLSFERYKEYFGLKSRLWHRAVRPRELCREAAHIIAVSNSTKNDLVELYGIPEEKITKVYSGVEQRPYARDVERLEHLKKQYEIGEKYVIYVGNIEPRKNISGIITSFLRSRLSKEYTLVLAGAGNTEKKRLEKKHKGLKKAVFTGYLSEPDKCVLLSGARQSIYPSFYEGFGFPPLEAMSLGVPTIVSSASSLPEVCGNSSICVNPHHIRDIIQAMEALEGDEDLRARFIALGKERAKKFIWEKTAQETLDIIRRTHREYEKNS